MVPDAPAGRNMRQSPFGTDVLKYESLTAYSWEDANGTTVKVTSNPAASQPLTS